MAKKSKKRERSRLRKSIRQEFAELQPSFSVSSTTIPPGVAALGEHYSESNFRLIFSQYNHQECELLKFSHGSQTKALINKFNLVTSTRRETIKRLGIRDNIHGQGQYQSLYDNLPVDIEPHEIKEIKFSGTGRIYFYTVESYFLVVAIQIAHK